MQAHESIGSILSGVMQDYAADGVQMFPTADEPSGYDLHSVKIARLAVREIAEVDVDDDGAVSESRLQPQEDGEPMSAVERGNESFKHAPPSLNTIVKEPAYADMNQKLKKRGADDNVDLDVDETDPQFIEYACIDVE